MAETETLTLQVPMLRMRAAFVPETFDPEDGSFEFIALSGELETIEFDPFPGPFVERLSLDPEHVDLSRFNAGTAAVLNSHGEHRKRFGGPGLEDQIGVVDSAELVQGPDGPQLRGRARLSKRESLAETREDVADGIFANLSLGYRVRRYADITQPDDPMPVKLAIDWQPFEVSLLPVGEDPGARIRSASSTNACQLEACTRTQPMTTQPNTAGSSTPDPSTATQAATVEAERVRGLAINEAVRAAGLEADVADELIEAGHGVDRARELILARVARSRTSTPSTEGDGEQDGEAVAAGTENPAQVERARGVAIRGACRLAGLEETVADELVATDDRSGNPINIGRARELIFERLATQDEATGVTGSVSVGTEAADHLNQGLADALEYRAGIVAQPTERGRAYAGMRLLRMGEEWLEANGVRARSMTPNEIAHNALIRGRDIVRARSVSSPMGTSDFPSLVANVADKRLRMAYDASPSSWRMFSTRAVASDFKPMSRVQLGEYPTLDVVPPGAEYPRGSVGESAESYSIAKHGKIIAFTREMMINDDLNALNRLPMLAGRSAAELEADTVWAFITGDVQLGDGLALFHANHSNTGTGVLSADGTGITSLGTGRETMRLQTGISAQRIGVAPSFLVVPAALETVAQRLTAMIAPNAAADVNPFVSSLRGVIVEPRLDADSAVQFYLVADPASLDVVEYAHLQGNEGPMIETREGFEVDGMEMKVRHEFGAAVLDHRGWYRSSGA